MGAIFIIKNITIILIFVLLVLGFNKSDTVIIPDEALRLRIVANSNSDYDQKIKTEVKEVVEREMYDMLGNVTNIDDAKSKISSNISIIDNSVSKTLKKNNYNLGYDLNFGYNYFPEKEFKGITYKEGYYESLLVTLGAGDGDNWWCVMFPPLCLLEAEESTEVEYKFFIKELIDKYF